MNNNYQKFNDDWQHTGEFISLWSKRHKFLILCAWHSNYTFCIVVGKQTGQSLFDCWFFCCRPRPGRGQMSEAEAEAKAMRPRPRPRPKVWPRGHFGPEDLTSGNKFEVWSSDTVLQMRACIVEYAKEKNLKNRWVFGEVNDVKYLSCPFSHRLCWSSLWTGLPLGLHYCAAYRPTIDNSLRDRRKLGEHT